MITERFILLLWMNLSLLHLYDLPASNNCINQEAMKTAFLQRLNKFFPFRNLFRVLLAFDFFTHLVIVSYNLLSGYAHLDGISAFFSHVVIGSVFMFIASVLISIPDLLIIRYLNQTFNWHKKVVSRVLIELLLSLGFAVVVSTLITLIVNGISAYKDNLGSVLINNALISSVLNILMMAMLEAWLFFMESNQARQKAEILEKELSQIRFEVLKSQINPHFMFNSLNVLSGLIEKDVDKAQLFIDEFAHVYRYVLETIEKPVVTLNEELDFVRSYMFLQQIRYGDALNLTVKLPADILKLVLPPLSLQLVLENAVKHNIVNQSNPLRIEIFCEDEILVVKNNIQLKISAGVSTGLGQNNLVKRYAMVCERIPQFILESRHYIVKLPLIKTDSDERTDS